ncbi:hypothetical protein E2542_SST07292 [Spatholobus suberectus]|nr:hypothetical protein E2542_SST07292 [Spatholobus suberectus]
MFLFCIMLKFLTSDTSDVYVTIYVIDTFHNHLVKFLISNMLSSDINRMSCFNAFQIQQLSQRFYK